MTCRYLSYEQTRLFSDTVLKYLNRDDSLKNNYGRWASIENFEAQIKEKSGQSCDRNVLVNSLKKQYRSIETSALVLKNIESLKLDNTFTVATGHQLCIFTGPLYFIYKILSTINLAEELSDKYPSKNFVPIFWLASEDHDFEEISSVNIFGELWRWQQKQRGAVGKIPTDSLKTLIHDLELRLGTTDTAKELIFLFKKAYLEQSNLAAATQYLVNKLFAKFGLVILDANNREFKKKFIKQIKADVIEKSHLELIKQCSDSLPKSQAFAREINFFYIMDGLRERIVYDGGRYKVLNSTIIFSRDEMIREIEEYPERFSPNVLLRPLYKELILPNIAMVGGGAELSYWMQLKSVFDYHNIVFPILVLRNSLLLVDPKSYKTIESLGFEISDLFTSDYILQEEYLSKQDSSDLNIDKELSQLEHVYSSLASVSENYGLKDTVMAEKQKQIKSLKKIEQKLKKAHKQKHAVGLNKLLKIKSKLFPNRSLQERNDNFIQHELNTNNDLILVLKKAINPLRFDFTILIDDK